VSAVLWLALLLWFGAKDQRAIGLGAEEIWRIIWAARLMLSVVAGVSYRSRADLT
jgi:hypothetical protein